MKTYSVGWGHCTVRDVAAAVPHALAAGPFGSNLVSADYEESGVPVIRGQNMRAGRWVGGDFVYVSSDKAAQLSSNLAHPGDLVFTQRGTLGQVAMVPAEPYEEYVVSQSQMKLTVDPAKADTLFLYYLFSSDEHQQYIQRNVIQTGVPHTNLAHLRTTPLHLPPLREQRAIAAVLGALDDKIELNRRMNQMLEAMAQALFQSWFVDFDPVRAKMEGRQPAGMDAETAELFPYGLVDGEYGELPDGWRAGAFRDVAVLVRGILDPMEVDADVPYIGLEHMPRRSIVLGEWGTTSDVGSSKARFRKGDILFGKLRPYFHKVGVAPVDGVCSTDILVVQPRVPSYFGFALGHLASDALIEYADGCSTGTKMPRINWDDLARYHVVLPPERVASAFTDLLRPMLEQIHGAILESRTLAALRDALLPKLLSGELRVAEAERLVEAIV